jgi:hypothetical protein
MSVEEAAEMCGEPRKRVKTSNRQCEPWYGVLQTVHFLNSSRTKLLITGLDPTNNFKPCVRIITGKGSGVVLSADNWFALMCELKLASTYIFHIDSKLFSPITVGNLVLGTTTLNHKQVVTLQTTINKARRVYLGESSVMNMIRLSRYYEHTLFQLLCASYMEDWYNKFILYVGNQCLQEQLNFNDEEEIKTRIQDIMNTYDILQDKYYTTDLHNVFLELSIDLVYNALLQVLANARVEE